MVDDAQTLQGIITDGDLRRMLEKNSVSENIQAKNIMSRHPKTISPDELAVKALDAMRRYEITQIVVVQNEKYLGMIHLHDLLREGFI